MTMVRTLCNRSPFCKYSTHCQNWVWSVRRNDLIASESIYCRCYPRFQCSSCCSIFSFMCNVLYIIIWPFVLFLLAIVMCVLLRFTASDCPFRFTRSTFAMLTVIMKRVKKQKNLQLEEILISFMVIGVWYSPHMRHLLWNLVISNSNKYLRQSNKYCETRSIRIHFITQIFKLFRKAVPFYNIYFYRYL